MANIEEGIEVDVPVRTAYNQWTQFESFPKFMEGVETVNQVTETRNYWLTDIAGVRREFDTEITEQLPDERIAWKTVDGPHHAGVVTFHRLDDNRCKVMLQMTYEPHGLAETVGDLLGVVRRRVVGDLARFKEFIEARGSEEGGWRGEVHQEHATG
jgi:uncharacterized membrane protein